MPIGLIIMKWDDRSGTEIKAKYPEEINITERTLMQIYSTHQYSGESGMISLMVGALSIASYYTGPSNEYYIILLLNLDDDPDSYEGGLSDLSRLLLQNIDEKEYKLKIPYLYQRLSVYPTLNLEQRLAITYFDEVKRKIIQRLRDEFVFSKSELKIWLKDQYKRGFLDLDTIIQDLVKREIVKEASVKGMPSELLFLINDISLSRIPPLKVAVEPAEHGLPESLVKDYQTEMKEFFIRYLPDDEDNLKILDAFVDPQFYETLRLLREAIVTKNELEKLRKKGVEDIDRVLNQLWTNKMIHVMRDKKNVEYYALISDFQIELIFPKYVLNKVIHDYSLKVKSDKELIEYLNILEDIYYDIKTARKKAEKERKKAEKEQKKKEKAASSKKQKKTKASKPKQQATKDEIETTEKETSIQYS